MDILREKIDSNNHDLNPTFKLAYHKVIKMYPCWLSGHRIRVVELSRGCEVHVSVLWENTWQIESVVLGVEFNTHYNV